MQVSPRNKTPYPTTTDFTFTALCLERECRAGGITAVSALSLNKVSDLIHPSAWQLRRGGCCVHDSDVVMAVCSLIPETQIF